jgi:hypothetical protein
MQLQNAPGAGPRDLLAGRDGGPGGSPRIGMIRLYGLLLPYGSRPVRRELIGCEMRHSFGTTRTTEGPGCSRTRLGGRWGAALAALALSATLGACSSTASSSRSGKCYTPVDQKRMENGTLENSRLNEILDCESAKHQK